MAVDILFGVSGCGKSSVGKLLSDKLGVSFIDADDLHPKTNLEKMANGIPLNDEDRWPWLDCVATEANQQSPCVVACSALRLVYRDRLRAGIKHPRFIHLDGSFELISKRLAQRSDHFMPTSLLQSQFDALEIPVNEEDDVLRVSIDQTLEALVDQIIAG